MVSVRLVTIMAILAFLFGISLGRLAFEYGYWSHHVENAADYLEQGVVLEERENVFADFWRTVLPMDEADSQSREQ